MALMVHLLLIIIQVFGWLLGSLLISGWTHILSHLLDLKTCWGILSRLFLTGSPLQGMTPMKLFGMV